MGLTTLSVSGGDSLQISLGRVSQGLDALFILSHHLATAGLNRLWPLRDDDLE
jgi:hypothetical protein